MSRSVRDTAAVLEWVSDPPPGEPYVAPARERAPTARRSGADPGSLRVGLLTRPPGGEFDGAPRLRGGGRGRRATARVAGPLGGGRVPGRARRRELHPQLPGALDRRRRLEPGLLGSGAPDARSARTTWSRSPGRWPSRAAATPRPTTSRAVEFAQDVTRRSRRVVGGRLRPAAHADDGGAAPAARRLRRAAGQPNAPDRDRRRRRRCSPPASTPPASRPSHCPFTCPMRGCRSACSWWPPTAREDVLSGGVAARAGQPWAERVRRCLPPLSARPGRSADRSCSRVDLRTRSRFGLTLIAVVGAETKRRPAEPSAPAAASPHGDGPAVAARALEQARP